MVCFPSMWNPLMGDPVIGPFMHSLGLGMLFPVFVIALALWVFAWKAIGLYHAARNGQRIWFVVLMLVHTVGILEIIYLKWFQKDMNAAGQRGKVFPFIDDVKKEVKARMPSSVSKERGPSKQTDS